MKKIIPGLILVTLLSLLVMPVIAEAQDDMVTTCTIRSARTVTMAGCGSAAGDTCTATINTVLSYSDCAICCAMDKVYMITDWIFFFVVALSIIFILYGGFQIVTAGGSDEKVTTGRKFIMWALIGFAVAILARALPMIVRYFVS